MSFHDKLFKGQKHLKLLFLYDQCLDVLSGLGFSFNCHIELFFHQLTQNTTSEFSQIVHKSVNLFTLQNHLKMLFLQWSMLRCASFPRSLKQSGPKFAATIHMFTFDSILIHPPKGQLISKAIFHGFQYSIQPTNFFRFF